MLPPIIALLHLFLGLQPVVTWVGIDSLQIKAEGREELLNRCIQSGIEVRYRFNMRYCRRRVGWFDACSDERSEIHILKYDPISEVYKVTIDRHGDQIRPIVTSYSSLEEAYTALTVIPSIPIQFVARDEAATREKNRYFGVNIIADCKDSFGSSLLDISYVLTFGLVKINRFDSGWIAFNLGEDTN